MSVATLVSRGYGSFGTVAGVVTRGFISPSGPPPALVKETILTRGYGQDGSVATVVRRGYGLTTIPTLVQETILTRGFGQDGTVSTVLLRGFGLGTSPVTPPLGGGGVLRGGKKREIPFISYLTRKEMALVVDLVNRIETELDRVDAGKAKVKPAKQRIRSMVRQLAKIDPKVAEQTKEEVKLRMHRARQNRNLQVIALLMRL